MKLDFQKLEFAMKLEFQKLVFFEKIYFEKFWKLFMVLELFMEFEYYRKLDFTKLKYLKNNRFLYIFEIVINWNIVCKKVLFVCFGLRSKKYKLLKKGESFVQLVTAVILLSCYKHNLEHCSCTYSLDFMDWSEILLSLHGENN